MNSRPPQPSPLSSSLSDGDQALVALLAWLRDEGYRFTAVTPLTHGRIWQRDAAGGARSLRDVFGWNFPFRIGLLPPAVLALMRQAGVLMAHADGQQRSAVRVAALGADLFVHSAYPTEAGDAVFFGPDTYRFAGFIRDSLGRSAMKPSPRLVDVGCGSGAGAVVAARVCQSPALVMNDINPLALRHAAVNAAAAALAVDVALGDALLAVPGEFDLIISNPPYLVDDAARAYRHGGERLGRALGVRIAAQALDCLAPGGRLLLYTGVAMVAGEDPFIAELQPLLDAAHCVWTYREIDPDVFGEELERPAYRDADRIAAVGLVAYRPSSTVDTHPVAAAA